MLRIEGLTIGYAGRVVAENLCHDFTAGTLTLLTGRNGSGKSTLLRTMAGFLPPLSPPESIMLAGKPLGNYAPRPLARLRAVVQTHYEPVNLSVRQMVEMGRAPYHGLMSMLSDADAAVVDNSLAECGLTDFATRSFRQLSDGERQRVMIAAALAQEAPVLLLDEPTAFLDYESRRRHFALLRHLADEGRCIICATHDLDMARQFTSWEYSL